MQSQRFCVPGKEDRLLHSPCDLPGVKVLPGVRTPALSQKVSRDESELSFADILNTYPQGTKNADVTTTAQANVPHSVSTVSASALMPYDSQVVSPSRLHYVGVQVPKGKSLSNFQGLYTDRFQPKGLSQAIVSSQNQPIGPTTLPINNGSLGVVLRSSVHPLLQQALLLIGATEVEERLAIRQEEANAFDAISTLLGVAKEVEVIRIAAFEMFHFERAYRRALKRQERHERRILQVLYSESYNDAQFSEEVRIIRQHSEEPSGALPRSFFRSPSASLNRQSPYLFEIAARQVGGPSSSPLFSFESRRHEEVRGCSHSSHQDLCNSYRASSPISSKFCFLRPEGSLSPLGSPCDFVNILDKRQYYRNLGDQRHTTLTQLESELEERIARQQTLLLPLGLRR